MILIELYTVQLNCFTVSLIVWFGLLLFRLVSFCLVSFRKVSLQLAGNMEATCTN